MYLRKIFKKMIQQNNNCKKEGCPKTKVIGCGGFCYTHRELDPMFKDKKKATERKNAAKLISQKIRVNDNPKAVNEGVDVELEKYFADAAKELEMKPYCHECGAFIHSKYYRAATCHLLPKNLFPSVKAHPLNKVFCCAGNCHFRTERTDLIPKMQIYPEIKEKLIALFPLVKEKHKYLTLLKEMVLNNP